MVDSSDVDIALSELGYAMANIGLLKEFMRASKGTPSSSGFLLEKEAHDISVSSLLAFKLSEEIGRMPSRDETKKMAQLLQKMETDCFSEEEALSAWEWISSLRDQPAPVSSFSGQPICSDEAAALRLVGNLQASFGPFISAAKRKPGPSTP